MAEGPSRQNSTAVQDRPDQAAAAALAARAAAKDEAAAPARGPLSKLLATSFTVYLLILLTACYSALWIFYPWRPLAEMDVPGWIVDFADQVDLMMTERNPPLVILGSSLTLAAPRRLFRPGVYQEEISRSSGRHLEACVMAVPGAIASDQDFILAELLAHKKHPRMLIYTYAPRDFMDNTIEGKVSSTPTRRVLTFINRRSSFLPRDLSPQALSQCFDNHAAFLDLVRRHVLRTVRTWACQFSGHPDSLWSASKQGAAPAGGGEHRGESAALAEKPEALKTTNAAPGRGLKADETAEARAAALKADLELYSRRYNPRKQARIDEQYQHLEELLKIARANDIKVELIGMPVSPANYNLLAPGVYQDMCARIKRLATTYGADQVDFNLIPSVKFGQDEYLDSVHLSTGGARHFVPLFVDAVVNSRSFQTAFPAKAQAR